MRVLALALCLAVLTTTCHARDNSPPKIAARVIGKVGKFGLRLLFKTAKTAVKVAGHTAVAGLKLATDSKTVGPIVAAVADPQSKIAAAAQAVNTAKSVLEMSRVLRRSAADDAAARAILSDPLPSSVPEVRTVVVRVASAPPCDAQCEAILKMLDSPSLDVREAAVRSLGDIGAKAAVEPLIDLLRAPELRLRLAAAESLGQIGDTRATDALRAALGDELVRDGARKALDMIAACSPLPSPPLTGEGE